MKWLLALIAALMVSPAFAAGALSDDLSWVLPTQRVDGTPLPIDEIAYTEIEIWRSGVVEGYEVIPTTETTYTYVRELPPNYEMCYAARVADTDGQPSDWTSLVCKTVRARPNPPGQLNVR